MRPSPKVLWPACMSALTLFLMTNALAKPPNMLGTWCSDDGREILYMEQNSIGFNEHTVCELPAPLTIASEVKMEISCANIYFDGDEIIREFEETFLFAARFFAPDQLTIIMDKSAEPTMFRRCYE